MNARDKGYRTFPVQLLPGGEARLDLIREVPLTLGINQGPREEILRTPGQDPALVAGICLSRGLVNQVDQITALAQTDPNHVEVRCRWPKDKGIHPVAPGEPLDPKIASACLDELLERQTRRLCSHSAALFDARGECLSLGEDVGRHNAVDKALGQSLLTRSIDRGMVLALTCRMGRDLILKAARAGIGILVSLSGPTDLAADTAREMHMAIISRNRSQELMVFCPGRNRLKT